MSKIPSEEPRKEAVSALIKIAALEAAIVAVVVVVFLATGKHSYLIGGLIGAQIIATPMIIAWARDHAPAMKAPPAQDGKR